MALDVVSQSRCFDGTQLTYQHQVPKQEHFGLGAGLYVDATQPSWSRNYRMAGCIERELPALIVLSCPLISRIRALWATPWADMALSQSPCAT